jgi:hypothetical protein
MFLLFCCCEKFAYLKLSVCKQSFWK